MTPKSKKNAGLRLRVEKKLRQEFLDACKADRRVAAEVLREFMRTYVARSGAAAQQDLFTPMTHSSNGAHDAASTAGTGVGPMGASTPEW